jgi:RNA polymerase sigma factor (sigma-70 family)
VTLERHPATQIEQPITQASPKEAGLVTGGKAGTPESIAADSMSGSAGAEDQRLRGRTDSQVVNSLMLVAMATLQNLAPLDRAAASNALDRLTSILRRFIERYLARCGIPNAWQEAMDIAQEVWVRFLRRDLAKRFDQSRSHLGGAYLFGVCRKVIWETLRKRRPHLSIPPDFDAAASDLCPDDAAAINELRNEVQTAIGKLNPALADAIRERFGLEAAGVRKARTNATHNVRVFRAKAALKPLLREHMSD